MDLFSDEQVNREWDFWLIGGQFFTKSREIGFGFDNIFAKFCFE
jgi:hypothetical protein